MCICIYVYVSTILPLLSAIFSNFWVNVHNILASAQGVEVDFTERPKAFFLCGPPNGEMAIPGMGFPGSTMAVNDG